MKTMKTIFKFILTALAVVTLFSCDIPLALGSKLDIEGPVLGITSPSHRKSVPTEFDLTGTINDKTGIGKMLITAKVDNTAFPRQWRYQDGAWQISDNYGASWASFPDGEWNGTGNSASWKIHVDMDVPGFDTVEGEYTFTVQSWDKADFTDDNSTKAVVVIIDLNPPKVDVSNPPLYRGDKPYLNNADFKKLHDILDNNTTLKEFEDPAYLGKFITQEFDLKWQVEDMNDVWSIDLRFYKFDAAIDDNPLTALPDDYIYRFFQNVPPVPDNVKPADFIRPNGTVTIPDLAGPGGFYPENNYQNGELKSPISAKTTIKIVASSYDAAGRPSQEKTIGYFIYWPRANNPWIIFPDGMKAPVYYPASGSDIATLENTAYMVYPSKDIKATAYQAYGVDRVEYTVYECGITGAVAGGSKGSLSGTLTPVSGYSGTIYSPGISTIFAWNFQVPPRTGYYVVRATAFSKKNKSSQIYNMLFRINDITFPDFPTPIQPAASEPLYLALGTTGTSFTISGTVSDATGIDTLCLVWINPISKGAAANSQLVYFRDKDYVGWGYAKGLTASSAVNGAFATEGIYDPDNPNKLWKIAFGNEKINPDTNRREYTFSKTINLSDLGIGPGAAQQALKSQMFLFRAENKVEKCTIITYAPQGDTVTPAIKVNDVVIKASTAANAATTATCYPNTYTLLPIFNNGNTINITGKWREDSVRNATNLNLTTFFKNFFEISINNTVMNHMANQPALNVTRYGASDPGRTDADGTWDGTWTLTAVVGNAVSTNPPVHVPLANLKDTLVIDARTRDIGGNIAQIGSSWLIKSDKLQLLRISSEKPDDIYGTNEEIEIFLEFSKPVQLNPSFNGNKQDIQLILSTASGNTARARYKEGQGDQSSRQYFVYKVASGENTGNTAATEYLNVTGLCFGNTVYTTSTAYNTSDYPFAWERGSSVGTTNSYEAVRLTMQSNANTTGEVLQGTSPQQYYVRTLPTSTTAGNNDYQFTLFAAKHIKIDTTLPRVSAISTTTPAGYYSAGDIYFTIEFSEPVKLGAVTPQFPLNFNGTTVWSSNKAADVRVNGKNITFKYTIVSPDTSGGKQIYVSAGTNMLGDIYDIAGNKLLASASNTTGNGLNGLTEPNRTLTGIYVETQIPLRPTVRVLPAGNITANDNNVISQDVKVGATTTTNRGLSSAANRNLSNIYNQNIYLAVEKNSTDDNATTPYKCDYMEYSIDSGSNWIRVPNNNNTPFILQKTGDYKVVARQVDMAGNKSLSTDVVNFNWDPGALLTRISSPSANGEYTHVTGRNKIDITLNFRKPLFFSPRPTGAGNPEITLNVRTSSTNNANVTVSTTRPTGQVSSLTFTYTVADGNYTATGTKLDITAFSTGANVDVLDGDNAGVLVTSLVTLPSGTPKLDSTKEFTVATGLLEFTDAADTTQYPGQPAFITDSYGGTDHGIREDDGSYWTTLRMTFNHKISKGDGNIIIKQIVGSGTDMYRLPTVLTEAQYNRFRGIADFDKYYIKGTNGYINGTGSDTTNKYILQYQYDPRRDVTATGNGTGNNGFNGNTPVPQAFIDAFLAAEAISIPVNSQAVTITNNDNTLNVRLSGSNAPQVPGAVYEITLPAGLVNDSLGNESSALTKNVRLRGVAKPFVRIKKNQETIKEQTGSTTAPRLAVDKQPFLAYARIDCRTPGSTISYTASTGQTNVTGQQPGNNSGNYNNNWDYATGPTDNATPNATRPTNATGTTYTNSMQIIFGYVKNGNNDTTTEPNIDNVQGFQWWVRARATTTANDNPEKTSKYETEEMAYRTVISFSIRNNNAEVGTATGRSRFESGDQAWIRGGDSIGSSSIPGFPFTWEDNWDTLKNKRAGIRLMQLVSYTTSLNNSLWRFITWDMNTTAYVDFIRGRDLTETPFTASTAAQAWQYGPKRWCYQVDGWTSFKDKYPVYAGKHRWCDMGTTMGQHGTMNFSGTFMGRPDKAVDHTSVNTQ
jgi:hypothetical protein